MQPQCFPPLQNIHVCIKKSYYLFIIHLPQQLLSILLFLYKKPFEMMCVIFFGTYYNQAYPHHFNAFNEIHVVKSNCHFILLTSRYLSSVFCITNYSLIHTKTIFTQLLGNHTFLVFCKFLVTVSGSFPSLYPPNVDFPRLQSLNQQHQQ